MTLGLDIKNKVSSMEKMLILSITFKTDQNLSVLTGRFFWTN